MNVNVKVVDAKLLDLESRYRSASEAVERLKITLEARLAETANLAAQIRVLKEVREHFSDAPPPSKKRPSKAIRDLVAQRPGISMQEVLDELEREVKTSSGNARHILRTTLSSLVKTGKLLRHDEDRFSLPYTR